jgi:hypothetical protein
MSSIKARLDRLTRTIEADGADRLWDGVDRLTAQETAALMSGGPGPIRPGAARMMDALFLDIAVRCILAGDDDDEFTRMYVDELGIEAYDDDEAVIRRALEHARADIGLTAAELDELRKWITHQPGDPVAVRTDP